MKKCFLIVIFYIPLLILNSFSFAQNKNSSGEHNRGIDSLFSLLKKDKPDTNKVKHSIKLCVEYRNLGHYDNALYYGNSALQLSQQLNFKSGLANSYGCIGIVYKELGKYSDALEHYLKALKIAEELADKTGIARHLGNIGVVYRYQGDHPKALEYYFRALKMDEELEDKNGIANQFGNIGNIYFDQKDYSKALDYYLRALKVGEKLGNKKYIENLIGNIGNLYAVQATLTSPAISQNSAGQASRRELYFKALDYCFRALKMAEELGNKNEIARHLGSIGSAYNELGDYPKALDYDLKALKMDEKIRNKNLIANALRGIGSVYTATGKFKEAEQYLKKAIEMDNTIGSLNELEQSYESISQLYDNSAQKAISNGQFAKAANDYKLLIFYYKKAAVLKDTLFSLENKKELVRKEMNFEFDKKEAVTIAKNEKQQALVQEKNRKQKIIIWSVDCGLLLVLVFAGFIFRSLRITRKQKRIIELKSAQTELQKKIIEQKNKEITASINYASRIQKALLTSKKYINKHLAADFFIFYQPKDIVSGDFYWAYGSTELGESSRENTPTLTSHSKLFYIATSDCTGHGVPGAFMSLLNISFLNENVIERKITEPNKILNEQRKEIIKALNPKGTENSMEGMDCVLCKFDFDSLTLTYAAANNPVWIMRCVQSGENGSQNPQLIECLPDKMPVGKYNDVDKDFSQKTIQLQKGDIVYTFTDGYVDQFGGVKGKKFKYKQLKNLFFDIHRLPMKEQRDVLKKTINDWKGNLDQVDDILVIGVKI